MQSNANEIHIVNHPKVGIFFKIQFQDNIGIACIATMTNKCLSFLEYSEVPLHLAKLDLVH